MIRWDRRGSADRASRTAAAVFLPLAFFLLSACSEPDTTDDPTRLNAVELGQALATGEIEAVVVTAAYLARIQALNDAGPALHAMLELNPAALDDAAALDAMFLRSGPVGPLHGIPVAIKGNIDVQGLAGTAGSLALAGLPVEQDAYLVRSLRAAGAVILGTTNLSEWANFRDANSSSGWSSLGGQTRNPHVLDRNPCGSSSGSAVAVAAALTALAVGTETNGSIVCPAGLNGIVGIKPTVGLVSRRGIIPISQTQDTAGPMARSVMGAALLLQSMAAHDPSDPKSLPRTDSNLLPDPALTHLRGKRIGVLRSYRGRGQRPNVEAVFDDAADRLQVLGATLIDPLEYEPVPLMRGASYRIMLREFKAGLNAYLTGRNLPAAKDSLADLIAFNREHAEQVMPHFAQSIFLEAEAIGSIEDPEYLEDIQLAQDALRTDVQALFASHRLDALFLPVNGPAWKTDWINGDTSNFGGTAYLAAITGYPSIVLPAGSVNSLPVGVGFVGLPETEAALIQIAYALEQALPARLEPQFRSTLEIF